MNYQVVKITVTQEWLYLTEADRQLDDLQKLFAGLPPDKITDSARHILKKTTLTKCSELEVKQV